MTRADFEILEHTADAGIVAYGATLSDLFAHAAEGMYAVMTDIDRVKPVEARDVRIEAESLRHLLSRWLLELLFLTETEGLLFSAFDVTVEGNVVRGVARGEPIDPLRHDLGGLIKGVTRHLLDVRQEPDATWRATVLFDI